MNLAMVVAGEKNYMHETRSMDGIGIIIVGFKTNFTGNILMGVDIVWFRTNREILNEMS